MKGSGADLRRRTGEKKAGILVSLTRETSDARRNHDATHVIREGLTKATLDLSCTMEWYTLCSWVVQGYFVVMFSEVQLETLAEEGEPQGSSGT